MKNLTISILLALVIGLAAYAVNVKLYSITLNNQLLEKESTNAGEEIDRELPTKGDTLQDISYCDIAHSFAMQHLSETNYEGKAFCGNELFKPFKTSIGTFIVKSSMVDASEVPYPGGTVKKYQLDTIYFVTESGKQVEVPLQYERAIGGPDVLQIESIIDFHNRILIVQLKGKPTLSFIGIDYAKGSNSIPISVGISDIFNGPIQ